jgi:hypothetical protein
MMPTGSLILSVLQILLDVAQRANELKENSGVPPSIVPNIRINDNHKSIASIGNGIFLCFLHCLCFFKCIMSLIFFVYIDIQHSSANNPSIVLSSLIGAVLKKISKPTSV